MEKEQYKSELQLQAICYQWFYNNYPQYRIKSQKVKVPRCLLVHNLLNAKSHVEAAKLNGAGLTKGLPDLVLYVPSQGYPALFIELKLPGEKPRPEQLEIFEALRAVGYKVAWVDTFEKFKNLIYEYLQ